MKKALIKDSIKEIKNTKKRFISILLMAFLGVGFFAGIRATSPDMVDTIDKYYDDQKFYDIQIMSTLGLTQDDITALKNVENVENVYGEYSLDTTLDVNNKQIVIKFIAIDDINNIILQEGKNPENNNQCIVEEGFLKSADKKVGDYIQLSDIYVDDENSEEKEEGEILLKEKEFQIVGVIESPLYISRDRGNTKIGSGKLDYYIYIPKEDFSSDIYTVAYLTLANAKEMKTSSKEYEDYIEETKNNIEQIKEERQKARYDSLINEATAKVNDAENELNEEEQKAQNEINDAENKIENGRLEISRNESRINNSKKQADIEFENIEEQINQGREQLEQGKAELDNKKQLANQTINQLNEQIRLLRLQTGNKATIAVIENQITNIQGEITKAENKISSSENELLNNEKELEKTKRQTYGQINSGIAKIEEGKKQLQENEKKLEESKKEFKDKIQEAKDKIQEAKDKITKIENPSWYILDRYSNIGYNSFIQDSKSIENIGKVFPIVFFVIATLISLTSMTRMVEEQRVQIGTLKSLGYNKIQIASKYLIYASLACIIGGILGMSVGFVLLPKIIWIMYALMYTLNVDCLLSFNIYYGGIGLGIASICIIGATGYAVSKSLAYTPAQLMRPKSPKMGKRVLLEKIPFIWKHLSFTRKVTVRNIFRYKKRFLMTIIGIAGCTALILSGFGLKDGISNILSNQYKVIYNYDMRIEFKNDLSEEEKQQFISKMKNSDKTQDVVEYYMTSGNVINNNKKEETQIIVPKDIEEIAKVISLQDSKTKQIVKIPQNEICITDKLAELINAKVGDTITLKDSEENEKQTKIGSIVKNYISHYIYMSQDLYNELYGKCSSNVLFISMPNVSSEEQEQFTKEVITDNSVALASRTENVINSMQDMMDSLNYVVIVLIISAGLLAFVVLYNLANVNISERIRELATIKVLGFYDKEVYNYISRETIILTAIGIIVGLIAGYFLNSFIIGTCELNILRFSKEIKLESYIYSILITIVFTTIVNIATYFSLKKIDMISSLKSVE